MGGHAFNSVDPSMVFPRMDRRSYESLRNRVLPLLNTLYRVVIVPPEAPGKADYGDLDVIVSAPLLRADEKPITTEDIRARIGATYSIGAGHMMNFAIPVQLHAPDADQTVQEWRQVDVDEVPESETLMVAFMKGYGDLGMILGMVTQSMGSDDAVYLKLSLKGLIARTPYGRVVLTSSPAMIAQYLGLDWTTWEAGFDSEDAIFRWVASCPHFRPHWFARLLDKREAAKNQITSEEMPKIPKERPMLTRFLEYCKIVTSQQHENQPQLQESDPPSNCETAKPEKRFDLQHALAYFSANPEYQRIRDAFNDPIAAKAKLNGNLVKEWVGLPQDVNIPLISKVMKIVKAELGGVKGILECDSAQLRSRVQTLWEDDQRARLELSRSSPE